MSLFSHAEPDYPTRITVGDHVAFAADLALEASPASRSIRLGGYVVRRHTGDERTFVLRRRSLVPGWLQTQVLLQPDVADGGYRLGTVSAAHRAFSRSFNLPDSPTDMKPEAQAMLGAQIALAE